MKRTIKEKSRDPLRVFIAALMVFFVFGSGASVEALGEGTNSVNRADVVNVEASAFASVSEWASGSERIEAETQAIDTQIALEKKLAKPNLLDDATFKASIDRYIEHFNLWKVEYQKFLLTNKRVVDQLEQSGANSSAMYLGTLEPNLKQLMESTPFEAELARLTPLMTELKDIPREKGTDQYIKRTKWLKNAVDGARGKLDQLPASAFNERVAQLLARYIEEPKNRDAIGFYLVRISQAVSPEVLRRESTQYSHVFTENSFRVWQYIALGSMVVKGRKGIWDFLKTSKGMTVDRYRAIEAKMIDFVKARVRGDSGARSPVKLTEGEITEMLASVFKAAGSKISTVTRESLASVAGRSAAAAQTLKQTLGAVFSGAADLSGARGGAAFKKSGKKSLGLAASAAKKLSPAVKSFVQTYSAAAVYGGVVTGKRYLEMHSEPLKVDPLVALPVIQQLLFAQLEQGVRRFMVSTPESESLDDRMERYENLVADEGGKKILERDSEKHSREIQKMQTDLAVWREQLDHFTDQKNYGLGFRGLTKLTRLVNVKYLMTGRSRTDWKVFQSELSKREKAVQTLSDSDPHLRERLLEIDENLAKTQAVLNPGQDLETAYTHLEVLNHEVSRMLNRVMALSNDCSDILKGLPDSRPYRYFKIDPETTAEDDVGDSPAKLGPVQDDEAENMEREDGLLWNPQP